MSLLDLDPRSAVTETELIKQATPDPGALPLAILLATGNFTVAEASGALAKNPVVREVIVEHTRSAKSNLLQ
jgi:hypothetical protein